MSGHNKWSTIKRKKEANDAKRSKMFTKIIKDITIAVREGGPDPDSNPRLRLAIANARGVNMPKDNIQRAINKATEKDSANYVEIVYEGYASHGVAIIVECATDNQQRTISNIRSYFNKHGGSLSTSGSLNFIFDQKGVFRINREKISNFDEFMLEAIDAGAEDVVEDDDMVIIYTPRENFGTMQKTLEKLNIEPDSSKLERIPNTFVKLDKDQALKILKLIDLLEDDDDVQNVYHNMELPDEVLDEIEE
ncbi:MAG: putative transcriptional regulatory protein YebC [Bacteroidetes bacterium ADurb.Bin035]|jgi:YebC/PmpR family DNA-binding regulatory protein|nr:MAG: putative transcriptional regulatory protein YebC [Bacteroidetes bacterium ADurb.Bin035]HOC41326.1 YebC/PmpR family DNA-binding transcriptional regulator [Bacteroidales bacterium]HOF06508.1 YebC/PmpR family DNA-binding transcriptional regulator [Bacteroidales bacterium]HOJ25465.1 YebC/PmpR family DNA-binding transcriptional regulator [Bacteroidales bacterium]HON98687.1 YebC/PmpR family DNA-binding transcriptional regulator [Bacteroidales bacterium]